MKRKGPVCAFTETVLYSFFHFLCCSSFPFPCNSSCVILENTDIKHLPEQESQAPEEEAEGVSTGHSTLGALLETHGLFGEGRGGCVDDCHT